MLWYGKFYGKLMEIINTILIVNPTYNRSLVANNEQSCFVRIVLCCMYVYVYVYGICIVSKTCKDCAFF